VTVTRAFMDIVPVGGFERRYPRCIERRAPPHNRQLARFAMRTDPVRRRSLRPVGDLHRFDEGVHVALG
jgi:hypothetical protein